MPLLVTLLAPPTLANAQQIDEIIVYGDLRESEIEDVPTSVTVLDEALIRQRNASHFEELVAVTANLNLSNGASRARFFQIRGVGERGQFIEPLNPSVGLLVDDVDFSGIGGISTLFDVEQIEVFRGPQGDLYGANALAGLISLRSHAAEHGASGRVRLEVGNYGVRSLGAAYGGSLSDTVAFRTSLATYAGDGYIHNTHLDTYDTNGLDEFTWRGKLRIDLSSSASLAVNLGFVDLDNGYDAFSLDNDRRTRSDRPGTDAQESLFGSLRLKVANEFFDTELSIANAQSDIEYGYDEDWTHEGFHPSGYSSTDQYNRDRDTLTAEVRLTSSEAGSLFDGRGAWVAGLHMLRQRVDLFRVYTYAESDFASQFEIQRLAAYGRIANDLSERGRLTLGLRLEAHESNYSDSTDLDYNPDENLIGGRIAYDHTLLENWSGYASVSRGYKAGGFNLDGSLDENLRQYDAEFLHNFELGLKGQSPDAGLRMRLALFRMDRDDVQIGSSTTLLRADGSSEFIAFIGNAAEGANQGVEAELSWSPGGHIQIMGSLGLLDTEYENYINGNGEDLGGREQAHAPRYQYHLAADFAPLENLGLSLTLEGRDAFYFSDSHDAKSHAYNLIHAALTWDWRDFSFSLWGRNLSDENYFVRGFFFGNDPRDDYAEHRYTQLGEPRRFGLTISHDF